MPVVHANSTIPTGFTRLCLSFVHIMTCLCQRALAPEPIEHLFMCIHDLSHLCGVEHSFTDQVVRSGKDGRA